MCKLFSSQRLAYASAVIIACLAIFVLPFCFPPKKVVYAASYVYGFNNSLCILSVLLSIGLFFLVNRRLNPACAGWLVSVFEPEAACRKERVRPWVVWLCCSVSVMFTAYLYVHTSPTPTVYYGEATYFLKRILLLLKGRSPYIDFDYQYGPALLQFPAYLYGLLAPWGVTLKATYYALHAAVSCAGFLLLAAVINWLGIDGKQKTVIFALCALMAVNETMGLQCTALALSGAPGIASAYSRQAVARPVLWRIFLVGPTGSVFAGVDRGSRPLPLDLAGNRAGIFCRPGRLLGLPGVDRQRSISADIARACRKSADRPGDLPAGVLRRYRRFWRWRLQFPRAPCGKHPDLPLYRLVYGSHAALRGDHSPRKIVSRPFAPLGRH